MAHPLMLSRGTVREPLRHTSVGGAFGVARVQAGSSGIETVLHSQTEGPMEPIPARVLTLDAAGNLFGTVAPPSL